MKKILILASILLIISCKNNKETTEASENDEVQEIQKPEVKLYTFDGGSIVVNNLNLFAQGDRYKGDSIQLANAFYVISHPKGNLLWDSGLSEGLVGQPAYTSPDGAFTITRKDSIINQLKTINLSPDDINFIAFSHVHFDHTGPANHFSKATWLVQESEYDFTQGEAIKSNGFYLPSDFNALTKVNKLNGDFDVFGDGSVLIKSMPGHTPGHQVLYLDLPNNGPTLLSGDMYHFQQNRTDKIVPQFNFDIPESEKSIVAFEKFAKEKKAKVYIQHEPNDFEKMPKSPKFLN